MTKLIAETAWHHEGDYDFMKNLVTSICKLSKADIVKFHITLDLDEYTVNNTGDLSVYPNPVETVTTISFASNITEDIEVIIYNQLGQIVERIDYMTVAGRNDLTWRRKSLNTGIYFISISGSISTYDTIKLLLK